MALLNRLGIAALALGVVMVTRPASAHVVPIPPSLCTIDPLGLEIPASGTTGSAGDAGDGALRGVYDANASVVRFCAATPADPGDCSASSPRSFALGAAGGTLALPARFTALMMSSGDLIADDVPVTITTGTNTVTVPLSLTTGLVAAGGIVMAGAPLEGLGSWVMLGVIPGGALPPPLPSDAVVVRLSCVPRPVPDKDQFVRPSVVRRLAGTIGAREVDLRAKLVLGPADRQTLAGQSALLVLRVDGEPLASGIVSGWTRAKRRNTASSADGRVVVTVKWGSANTAALTIRMLDVTGLKVAQGGPSLVGLTFDTGRLLARGERLFHPDPEGNALRR
ncbi:MAG TPA: hypothetical protein VMS22_18200 [Candidatus Eisenbacteria bacterium]|nr:hypothetical protein [Candidatus Eisenbacteria bacterium]